MAKDLLGRPVITAADLDAMTPAERQAAFDASIVTDLSVLPDAFRAQLLADADTVANETTPVDRGTAPGAPRAS